MDEQEVRYSFTGDLGNLKDAVTKAMGFLDQYAAKFKKTDAASTMKKSKKSFEELRGSLNSLGTAFSKANKQSRNLGASVSVLSNGFKLLGRSIGAITAISLGKWLSDATNESIKYIENLNLFKVAMGESVDQGLEFVDKMSELYGMDPSNLYRYSGYFYELTDAIGMAEDASATLSLSMTKASNDIASLFNIDIETVVNNLASGMQGMSRSVRKYGMDIRAVTLQQTALAYGLTEQVENMSEADRMALRYLTMMNQVKDATSQVVDETVQASGIMGDFARNIETPANQLRIFKEQVSQLGRAIGNFLIPVLSKLLPIINGVIMAIRTVLTFLSALTGFNLSFGGASSGAANTAKSFNDMADAAGGASKAAKELKKTLAPFDELNLLQAPNEDSGGGGAGGGTSDELLNPALVEAIQNMSLGLEDIEMKANKVRDSLLDFFGFDYVEVFNPDTGEYEKKLQWFADQFETNLINKFPQWSKTITALFDNWNSIIEGIKGLFRSLGEVLISTKDRVKEFIDSLNLDDSFSEGISGIADSLNSLSSWISAHKDQIADFILSITGIVLAFRAFRAINTFIKPLITLGTAIAPVIAQLVSFAAPILALVATIALLYTNSESFAVAFQNLFSTIVQSLTPIADSVAVLVQRIWESVQSLWLEHLQPMVASIGGALAPIIDTLSVLWEAVSTIIQSFMELLGNLWEQSVAPILAAASDAISKVMEVVQKLWTDIIGPILKNIMRSLPEVFDTVIRPVVENVMSVISGLIVLILEIWNHVLQPIVMWLINTLGPSISSVVNTVWNIVARLARDIAQIISNVLGALRGVITFLTGMFAGNWRQAWQGIVDIFKHIFNAVGSVVQTVLNGVISVINGVLSVIWAGLTAFINGILSTINRIGSFIGQSWNLQISADAPTIGYVNLPMLATGGVVTGPTEALIGEGRYDEAVIPLGNSPQMNEFADKVAGKINTQEQVALLREQNQILRDLLKQTGNSVGIKDLTRAVTRIQKQEIRAGGVG